MTEESLKIPTHIGIIVDGNGRWAKERNKKRSFGHRVGADNLKKISLYAIKRGVKVLSLFVFSTENFKRDKKEVDYLMHLFAVNFKKNLNSYMKKNIKIIFSGRKENLDANILEMMEELTSKTCLNTKGIINFCLNYGGQAEILDAIKKIVKEKKDVDNMQSEEFNHYLYQDLPPVDLVIRTSGEQRISNFMLWQCSYAEFYFPKTYFPDFTFDDFELALLKYNKRERRFGGVLDEKENN